MASLSKTKVQLYLSNLCVFLAEEECVLLTADMKKSERASLPLVEEQMKSNNFHRNACSLGHHDDTQLHPSVVMKGKAVCVMCVQQTTLSFFRSCIDWYL